MKRFVSLALSLSFLISVHSQKAYFIYLQSESEQPFFVRLNEQVFNSHAVGYLTIPRLGDSTYLLKVGFPNNKFPEQNFQVDMKGKDRGFLVKNFGEKGWGLYDLQTLAVIMAIEPPKDLSVITEPRVVTPFTEVLSRAANDPSLKEKTVWVKSTEKTAEPQTAVAKEAVVESKPVPVEATPIVVVPITSSNAETKEVAEVKNVAVSKDSLQSTAKTEEKKDTLTAVPTQQTQTAEAKTEVVDKPVVTPEGIAVAIVEEKKPAEKSEQIYEKSVVTRRSESSTTEGFGAIYIDSYADGHKDTIRIIIPNPKSIAVNTPLPVIEEKAVAPPVEQKENQVKPDAESVAVASASKSKFEPCKAVATEQEYISLRKKMAGHKNDEDKIKESRKAFKSRCFTTAQISNLGTLFTNEAGKFQFYEGAYPFVSDREGYGALQNEFKDTYFVYRFKNLIAQ